MSWVEQRQMRNLDLDEVNQLTPSHMCSSYERSGVTQLDPYITVRNLDSNEITFDLNYMASHLIPVENFHLDKGIELLHVTSLVE